MSCCGKLICSGCIHAVARTRRTDIPLCPFCRTPAPESDGEINKRMQKRVEVNDAKAIYTLGIYYSQGKHGLPLDWAKAFESYYRAAELGYSHAYCNIGNAHLGGEGVKRDMKKAMHYWERAAMKGDATARHNLGVFEANVGNIERALKHYMIAEKGGHIGALKKIQDLYSKGLATKDDYTKALRGYQVYLGEVKSSQRNEAAAADEDYKYIA